MAPDITPRFVEPDSIESVIRDVCMYATDGGLCPGITILLTCDDEEVTLSSPASLRSFAGFRNTCWTSRN